MQKRLKSAKLDAWLPPQLKDELNKYVEKRGTNISIETRRAIELLLETESELKELTQKPK